VGRFQNTLVFENWINMFENLFDVLNAIHAITAICTNYAILSEGQKRLKPTFFTKTA